MAAGHRRIDTLIPYKEADFRPQRRLGKLDTSSSCWAIASKLGRHLISGLGPEADVVGLAREVAARMHNVRPEDLELVSPEESGLRPATFTRNYPSGSLIFRDEEGGLFVMCPKEEREASHATYAYRPHYGAGPVTVTGMSLPCALGALEILDGEPGRFEAVIASVAEEVRESEMTKLSDLMALKPEADANEWGIVNSPEFGYGEWSRLVNEQVGRLEADDLQLLGLDTRRPEEIAWKVVHHYRCVGPNGPKHWGTEARRVFCEMAERTWGDESAREQNREWADADTKHAHTARVGEDKRNCDDAHRAAAKAGFVGREFSHAELDDRCDVGEFLTLERELEARVASGEIPSVTLADHELRFRLTGRHHATGLYFPMMKSIVVDPRHPSSLLHEFAHAYDFEHQQMSTTDDAFRETVYRPFCEAFVTKGLSPRQITYYRTPTEVFARAWEAYALMGGFGGSFVKTAAEYEKQAAYAPFLTDGLSRAVTDYFDAFAKPTEIAPSLERLPKRDVRDERACELVVSETEDLEVDWGDVEVGGQLTLAI